jgi:hypothetical protein
MQVFRFDMTAGTAERRVFMHELGEWLREVIGLGFFSVADSEDEFSDVTKWVVVCFSDKLKVIIRNDNDATAFALKWT